MTSLSGSLLGLLHNLAAGGLVVSTLIALLCAVVVLRTGSEQDRRLAALAEQGQERAQISAEQDEAGDAARLRARLAEAEARAVAASERADELETKLADAEVERLAAQVEALEAGTDEPPALERASRLGESEAAQPVRPLPPEAEALLRPTPGPLLAQEQANTIIAELAPYAGDFSIEVTSAPDERARLYAAQLAAAFRGAGIATIGPYGVLTTFQGDGVFISVEGAAAEPGGIILSALQSAALPAQPGPSDGVAADILAPEEADVRLYVGGPPTSS
ncbi:hypothetical protein [Parvularcula dongshanensis]|uniref:Murein DD-endopeptidase MepM/ murein hydrolase activator NlpD n=1 Tax=Parvularcula dongshanensis TaxID=1173995 RepID=A0A840I3N3_9PROT|nr:hypothetical protein [Parvularcula dongshanensis]MBB4658935.1 murein DD-endopeptidase MepM/ murein hydrolase activator NlpD [Parvularcula dongshanensis]